MIALRYFRTRRPVLIYRSRCRPCRRLSRVARLLSLGVVVAFADVSAEAEHFWGDYPELRDRLILISGSSITTDRAVFTGIPAAVLRCLLPRRLHH